MRVARCEQAGANALQFSMIRRLLASVRGLLIAVVVALPAVVNAQDAPDDRLRVFLDCPSGGCDRNFIVNEHPYAIWTQDRLDADVHLLITRLRTGAGGNAYTLLFIAQRRLTPGVDTLTASVPPNSSDDMQRRTLSRVINLGLASDAARFAGTELFTVVYAAPELQADAADAVATDRWNLWVYRARLSGNGSAESRSKNYELSAEFGATRVSDTWKLSFDAENEYRSQHFTLSDGTERQFALRSGDVNARVVRSVSQHWSVGTQVNAGLSEFRNQDAFVSTDVSVEYNVFPWEQATSRQLVGILAVGSRFYDYSEITIFDRASEHRPVARAIIAGESRQRWGTVDGSLRYTQFLHDPERYNVSFYARSEFRLTRGLSLDIRANAAKVQDQLYLPRGEASDDEVLTRQRALATAYRLSASVGISFTFGSIYNNIVNPRLNELGR